MRVVATVAFWSSTSDTVVILTLIEFGRCGSTHSNTLPKHKYECSSHLRGNLMHNLGRGVLQRVLQVVLKVAEELAGTSLHHIQQSSAVIGVHIWE